jgi:hypothetical protein
MKDSEISSPEELDAALVSNRMRRRENLWKTAAGQTYQWVNMFTMAVGLISLLLGGYGVIVEKDIGAIMLIVMGGGLIGSAIFRHQQSQIQALRRLLKDANLRDT